MLKRFWPFALLIFVTPFTPWLDLTTSHLFFPFSSSAIWKFSFDWAPSLAWVTAGCALLGLLTKRWRRAGIFYLLAFGLGPGLLINGILKPLWQRPRPVQTIDFGGFAPFYPFWEPVTETFQELCRSFPCGHASMGFIFLALYFIGKRERCRWLARLGILLTVVFGGVLSVTRLAMGGHYFSDILASFVLIWAIGLLLERWLYRSTQEELAIS